MRSCSSCFGTAKTTSIYQSEFGSEIDCFQGLGLKCLHVQLSYDWEQWGSIAAPPWGPNALNHS